MQPLGVYGWAYGEAVPVEQDQIIKKYKDPKEGNAIQWEMANLRMYVKDQPDDPDMSYYNSQVQVDIYGAPTPRFRPIQFHFHHPSEHTVNGEHIELEMHIIHKAAEWNTGDNVIDTVVIVWFSVENFDRDISQKDNQTLQLFFD
mmetsp:Transcript_35901/g.55120  ORF Transcript_35901/g.55120 Transcript_35901/m.55120 type:complete len:145 (+) Transcript_35901:171-605(+)|eukprot:CAMPEP_0170491168 /NCGR_PEP_ID=MMETSP0208-20121228/10519_1 /TAXON_ID=197538 /ORGANISM="Strombidium inclinatum, Strain S3" /LENGTH=144 /DNA_ID=CAMNT_0010766697 /DNA_START=172 /DNA_END=606 /DNA_ORIENTATION=-